MHRTLAMILVMLAGCATSGGNGRSGSGYAPPPPPGAARCSGSALCMRVVPMRPAPPLAGRLVVVWAPIGDDDRSFLPEIGYDAPFYGNERTAVIPYSALVLPRRLQMFPACLALYHPECEHLAGVATGYILVVPATGGPVNPLTVFKSTITAVGRLMVGSGTEPIAPGGVLRDVFPGGIARGLAPYAIVKPQGRSYDQMALAAPGTWFDLVSCTLAEPHCNLPIPDLN